MVRRYEVQYSVMVELDLEDEVIERTCQADWQALMGAMDEGEIVDKMMARCVGLERVCLSQRTGRETALWSGGYPFCRPAPSG